MKAPNSLKVPIKCVGEIFTSRAIEPQFISAAGMPSAPSALLIPDHVAQLVVASKPGSPEATRIGRSRVLPTLLAGVLPQAGKGRLGAYVRALLMETTSKGHTWVLQHKKVSALIDAVLWDASVVCVIVMWIISS